MTTTKLPRENTPHLTTQNGNAGKASLPNHLILLSICLGQVCEWTSQKKTPLFTMRLHRTSTLFYHVFTIIA